MACWYGQGRLKPTPCDSGWSRDAPSVPSPARFWPGAPRASRHKPSQPGWWSGTTPRVTAAMRCGAGSASPLSRSSGVQRSVCVSWSAHGPGEVHGSISLRRHGSTASEPCRTRTGGGVQTHGKHGSMLTMAVNLQRISSCQKRSLDDALGTSRMAATAPHVWARWWPPAIMTGGEVSRPRNGWQGTHQPNRYGLKAKGTWATGLVIVPVLDSVKTASQQ
jgi:hypothetical protein